MRDVEFSVDDASGKERVFKNIEKAAAFAVAIAASGRKTAIDVLVWSEAGAKAYGGDDAVARYRESPDASVFDRIVITADVQGMIP